MIETEELVLSHIELLLATYIHAHEQSKMLQEHIYGLLAMHDNNETSVQLNPMILACFQIMH
jgi:hypothetical protein